MKRFLLRQVDAALFRGRKERIPLLILGAGAWMALRIVAGRKGAVVYRRQLNKGESITITTPANSMRP